MKYYMIVTPLLAHMYMVQVTRPFFVMMLPGGSWFSTSELRGALLGKIMNSLVEWLKLVVALTELHLSTKSAMKWIMDVLEACVFVVFPQNIIFMLVLYK